MWLSCVLLPTLGRIVMQGVLGPPLKKQSVNSITLVFERVPLPWSVLPMDRDVAPGTPAALFKIESLLLQSRVDQDSQFGHNQLMAQD